MKYPYDRLSLGWSNCSTRTQISTITHGSHTEESKKLMVSRKRGFRPKNTLTTLLIDTQNSWCFPKIYRWLFGSTKVYHVLSREPLSSFNKDILGLSFSHPEGWSELGSWLYISDEPFAGYRRLPRLKHPKHSKRHSCCMTNSITIMSFTPW